MNIILNSLSLQSLLTISIIFIFTFSASSQEDIGEKIEGISIEDMYVGQTIILSKVHFQINQYILDENSIQSLDEIYDFLIYNPDIEIEIGGHTNRICDDDFCDELSTARAKAIEDYLIDEGIDSYRLAHEGYGKRKPIAFEKTPVARQKNKRIEITILSMNE